MSVDSQFCVINVPNVHSHSKMSVITDNWLWSYKIVLVFSHKLRTFCTAKIVAWKITVCECVYNTGLVVKVPTKITTFVSQSWLHVNFYTVFFFFAGLWSQSADKLSIHSILDFINRPFLKVHPPICRITAHATARLEFSTIFVSSYDPNEWCLKNGLHSGGLSPGPFGHESSALTTRPPLLTYFYTVTLYDFTFFFQKSFRIFLYWDFLIFLPMMVIYVYLLITQFFSTSQQRLNNNYFS